MGIVAVCGIVLALIAYAQPERIIETLASPVEVTGWTPTGIHLADGRSVMPRGMRSLPGVSAALTEATRRGIELAGDGRVFGLVQVHRLGPWIDPIDEHIARVDLALYLEFLREGQAAETPVPVPVGLQRPEGRFLADGWDLGEYRRFRFWLDLVNDARRGATPTTSPGPA
jgi:hypothetical protein